MKAIIYPLALTFLLLSCHRQGNTVKEKFRGHHYSQAHDVSYGSLPDQKMDIFCQGTWVGEQQYWQGDTQAHPTLVYIHGGGWMGGTKNQITPFILAYIDKGYNVVTLDYRIGPGTAPQAVDDCMQALQWISRHAGDYNIDTKNIIVSGESAGGHLALISGMLNCIPGSHPCYCGDSLKVQAIVNWFGITDIKGIDRWYSAKGEPENYAAIWMGSPARMDSLSLLYSPVNRVQEGIPAIITIHGKKDSVVPYAQAESFHKLLTEKGFRNELVSFENGTHLGFTAAEFDEAYGRIFRFLEAAR